MVDDERDDVPRILFCAHTLVPGSSATGARFNQLISAFSDELEVDALTLKGGDLSHIQRLGAARMLRVPVGDKPFVETLASYQRALSRQLEGYQYDLVYCGDIFSADIAARLKAAQGFALHIEIDDFPATSFAKKYAVDAGDRSLKRRWKNAQKKTIQAADKIIAPSRYAARAISDKVDSRRVHLIGRAVDLRIFRPPSMEIDVDGKKSVAVFERRGPTERLNAALSILNEVARKTRAEELRLLLIGAPSSQDERIKKELRRMEILDRVEIVDIENQRSLASVLKSVDVVVVPSSAESGITPFATPHRALEAMACERATVITGPETAFHDVVTPNVEACVVPAESHSEVANSILSLLDDDKRRIKMARAGGKKVGNACNLSARNLDFATSIAEAVGIKWTPTTEGQAGHTLVDEDESRHDAKMPKAKGVQKSEPAAEPVRETTVTSLRPPDDLRDGLSSVGLAWANDDDVIEISEAHSWRAPSGVFAAAPGPTEAKAESDDDTKPRKKRGPAKRASTSTSKREQAPWAKFVPSGSPTPSSRLDSGPNAESKSEVKPETKDSKREGDQPDVQPVRSPPGAPVRGFFGEPSTESGAIMGAPKGEPLKLPYFSKALQVKGLSSEENKRVKGTAATFGLSRTDGGEEGLMPAPKTPYVPDSETSKPEAMQVASRAALNLVEMERKRTDREPTFADNTSTKQMMGGDPWAPDTVADASPFEVDPALAKSKAHPDSAIKKRGLLVERDPSPDVTAEDPALRSSDSSPNNTR